MAAMVFLAVARCVAQSYFGGLPIDGIHCDRTEGAVEHVHASLQLYDRGHAVAVPANIGMPQGAGCLYWIHTHSGDGIHSHRVAGETLVHAGAVLRHLGARPELDARPRRLTAPHGQRLSIWVDGKAWHGSNPRAIVLHDRETIVIQSGPPFAKPVVPDWSQL